MANKIKTAILERGTEMERIAVLSTELSSLQTQYDECHKICMNSISSINTILTRLGETIPVLTMEITELNKKVSTIEDKYNKEVLDADQLRKAVGFDVLEEKYLGLRKHIIFLELALVAPIDVMALTALVKAVLGH